jgi:hypothetical protein
LKLERVSRKIPHGQQGADNLQDTSIAFRTQPQQIVNRSVIRFSDEIRFWFQLEGS